jgi:hypothetical protein
MYIKYPGIGWCISAKPSLFAGFLKDLELGEDELTKAGVAELCCQLKSQ